MTEEELERAVAPVREHFRSDQLTTNTVLAAHLRAIGTRPMGVPWQRAKAALKMGHDFAAAARLATGAKPLPEAEMEDLSKVVSVEPRVDIHHDVDQHGRLTTATDVALTTATDVAARVHKPNRGLVLPAARAKPGVAFTGNALTWFPKMFGPGDIDGDGALRLLGTPNIPIASVLVRETAQNSWDARLGTVPVHFSLHLRPLSEDERTLLRDRILTGGSTGLGLPSALDRPRVWVLEIADRGTKGLGGPVRNDLEVPAGITTNFIDLIMNIGAPRDVHLGGGTYGFGKTVAYQVSSCGTVVFWSKSHEEHGIEDRLIGSAIGRGFSNEGRRYTGRHWWGRLSNDGQRVEPMVGDEAADLAGQVFANGFEAWETGTSLMIVDPKLGGSTREEDATRLAESVLWHLWPKLIEGGEARTPMEINIFLDGEPVAIPPIEQHPILCGFADALNLVRAAQRQEAYTPHFNTEVFEVRSYKPEKLLGHLALARYPLGRVPEPASEISVIDGPSSHVSLMRHDAELVVKYDSKQRLESDALQWAGVFKPVAAVDDSFAAAEPPAHDDWVPDAIQDRRVKRDVRVAMTRMRELVRSFLDPVTVTNEEAAPARSVAALADSLALLVGSTSGNAPSRRRAQKSGSRQARPQVRIVESHRWPAGKDRAIVAVRCTLNAPTDVAARLQVSAGVGVEGGSDDSPDLVSVVGWATERPSETSPPDVVNEAPVLTDGQDVWLLVDAFDQVAVDVSLSALAVTDG